ncbi:MAG: NADH-quinone oxidoreductase subunit D-related protein [Candidatus Latescibacterota bacterium]
MEVKTERPAIGALEVCAEVEGVLPTATGVEVSARSLQRALTFLLHKNEPPFDTLIDITCVDRLFKGEGERFAIYYQLRSSREGVCIEVVSALAEGEELASVVALWPAAAWLELEIRDFFGLGFCGHPDLRHLFFHDSHQGYPLRKDFRPTEYSALANVYVQAAVIEEAEEEDGQVNLLDFGCSNPAWGRAQNMSLSVEGDRVHRVESRLGYAYAGIEKLAEERSYMSGVELAARLGPRCARAAALAFVLATEELLSIEVPMRARTIRVIGAELERIVAHLAWYANLAQRADSHAICRYAWEVRSEAVALLQGVPIAQVGGVQTDIGEALAAELISLCSHLPDMVKTLDAALIRTGAWSDRAHGAGVLGGALALAWGASGPVLRASGIAADRRLDAPYCDYHAGSFTAIIGECGDAWDRCYVRLREIELSAALLSERLLALPAGEWRLMDEKVVVPVAHERGSAEGMIHHFAIWMHGHGLQPPAGKTAFVSVEAPAGELGCFIVSDGSDRPCRLHFRAPSLLHTQIFSRLAVGLSLGRAALVWDSLDISAAETDR